MTPGALSEQFGNSPVGVPGFVIAQLVGAGIGVAIHKAMTLEDRQASMAPTVGTSVQAAKEP